MFILVLHHTPIYRECVFSTFYFKKVKRGKLYWLQPHKIALKINHKGTMKMGIKGKNDRMVVLACEDCKERNYTTVKNKKNTKDRLELSKYCPTCKKHTTHKETK